MLHSSAFKTGDWVEVRSKEEILLTLDPRGCLDGLPFMPEMFQLCGQRHRVHRRAHKTCDPPNGLEGRRMTRTVHLEGIRCDGSAHGGCQAGCLIFWKDEWLKKTGSYEGPSPRALDNPGQETSASQSTSCAEPDVWRATRAKDDGDASEPIYVCQSTQVAAASKPLRWWHLDQYIEDWTSGNVSVAQLAGALLFSVCDMIASAGIGLGSLVRSVYDVGQRLCGGTPYPFRPGLVPRGVRTPSACLGLGAGDVVKVRSHAEILATVNETGHNRGMLFDGEMVPFCGGTYRVLQRVTRIIDETTGRMRMLPNDCIQLEGVVCQARYSKNRRFCPRGIYSYWREIWLERVLESAESELSHRTDVDVRDLGRAG